MNTITQYLRRGTLDEQTAAVMKRLAKDKLERAIGNLTLFFKKKEIVIYMRSWDIKGLDWLKI